MLLRCHFGRKEICHVATHFILLSSTAESSTTSGYVVVPERFVQNEEPAGINEERVRKNPFFVPSCRGHLLGQSFVSSDRGRGPLQDEDHSGSRPLSFPGLYLMRSGELRNGSGVAL